MEGVSGCLGQKETLAWMEIISISLFSHVADCFLPYPCTLYSVAEAPWYKTLISGIKFIWTSATSALSRHHSPSDPRHRSSFMMRNRRVSAERMMLKVQARKVRSDVANNSGSDRCCCDSFFKSEILLGRFEVNSWFYERIVFRNIERVMLTSRMVHRQHFPPRRSLWTIFLNFSVCRSSLPGYICVGELLMGWV